LGNDPTTLASGKRLAVTVLIAKICINMADFCSQVECSSLIYHLALPTPGPAEMRIVAISLFSWKVLACSGAESVSPGNWGQLGDGTPMTRFAPTPLLDPIT